MAFDANKQIKIDASESEDGSYVLRTAGLAKQRRAELEMVGVAQPALTAAAGILNLVATYSVDRAEVLAGQSVGNVLAVGDEGRPLLLAVRAVSAQKSKGLFAKLGGDRGVLRLHDVDAKTDTGPARTALATMLVHRATVRLAKDDAAGARTELDAAIEILPGASNLGPAVSIAGMEGTYNWQNHCAYLVLAEALEHLGARAEAAQAFAMALERSDELARSEIGLTCEELLGITLSSAMRDAAEIIAHNLAKAAPGEAPSRDLATLPSPIWERMADDSMQRRASLVPSSFVELYYEGAAADGLRARGAKLVEQLLSGHAERPWSVAWTARKTRALWVSEEAPYVEPIKEPRALSGILSTLLADVARAFRASATDEEIRAHYGPDGAADLRASYDAKLAKLSAWESAGYVRAMSDAM